MLEVRGLRVDYGHVQALRGVDLEAREREITAIIGSNGAGKTSTLMAISGLAPITGGEGGIGRTIVGAFFLAFMINGFNLNGVDPIYQRIVQGLVMLGAVLIAARSSRRQS